MPLPFPGYDEDLELGQARQFQGPRPQLQTQGVGLLVRRERVAGGQSLRDRRVRGQGQGGKEDAHPDRKAQAGG